MTQAAHSDLALRPRGAALPHLPVRVLVELTKARLSLAVVLTAAVGYLLAGGVEVHWWRLLWTVLGTALAAGCANGLNQVMEAARDARMCRTRGRPLPSGRITRRAAVLWSVGMGLAGCALLATCVNLLTAGLAVAAIAIYLLLYTPLKPRSTLNTLVGAVCGALPPMMGWAGATGRLDTGAWALALILFIWQVPHFMALAWLYRQDYRRGGFRMLPAIDPRGRLVGPVALLYSLALVPAALTVTLLGLAGAVYALGSIALGLWLILISARFHRRLTSACARRLFVTSVIYLPVLFGLMALDRGPASWLPSDATRSVEAKAPGGGQVEGREPRVIPVEPSRLRTSSSASATSGRHLQHSAATAQATHLSEPA